MLLRGLFKASKKKTPWHIYKGYFAATTEDKSMFGWGGILLTKQQQHPSKFTRIPHLSYFCSTEGFDKRQREGEKLECIIFSITLPAMIASTLAIKKF